MATTANKSNETLSQFRGEAKRLSAYLKEIGQPIKHGHSLEAIARVHEANSWNVLAAQSQVGAIQPTRQQAPSVADIDFSVISNLLIDGQPYRVSYFDGERIGLIGHPEDPEFDDRADENCVELEQLNDHGMYDSHWLTARELSALVWNDALQCFSINPAFPELYKPMGTNYRFYAEKELFAQASSPASQETTVVSDKVSGRFGQNAPLDMTQAVKPLTYSELVKLTDNGKHYIEIVVAVDFDELLHGDIEVLNDNVSEQITGNCGALTDLSFDPMQGYTVGRRQVAVKVVAGVDVDTLDADLRYYVSQGWDHIFGENKTPRTVRFVFDRQTEQVVRMDILTGTGPVAATHDERKDVAESVLDNLDLSSAEDLGLEATADKPEWAI